VLLHDAVKENCSANRAQLSEGVKMDWSSLWLAAGAATTSGINLYVTVLTLGFLQRFHWLKLPGEWGFLGETWVLGLAAVLFLVEFVADKIPYVDNIWDSIHTFIRVPAGAVLMASAFADVDGSIRLAAGLLGGSLALTTHGAKATARLAVNSSPEPFSNVILSVLEDVLTVFLLGLSATHPWMAGMVLLIVLSICAMVIYAFFKFTKLLLRKLRGSSIGRTTPSAPSQ
jgi:uncharacterized membrane protein